MMIAMGKLGQFQATTTGEVVELKRLIKDQTREFGTRFDRMQDCLNRIGRKVG